MLTIAGGGSGGIALVLEHGEVRGGRIGTVVVLERRLAPYSELTISPQSHSKSTSSLLALLIFDLKFLVEFGE